MESTPWALTVLTWLEIIFIAAIILFILSIAVMYVIDVTQNTQTIRKNYPVIGRFRYFFEHLGAFFRQYFYAQDREELPFNRAERAWIYRSAKNVDNNIGFGSTLNLQATGTLLFLNSPFPVEEDRALPPAPITVGPYTANPYITSSIFNISAMSYGALSAPAIIALSRGAKLAGCWLNTGEGGLSPYHLEGGADLVFQIGTAKYGVRDKDGNLNDERLKAIADHPEVKMFEIKISQGAKPGKGGILPATKVTAEVALIRGIHVGEASISPNGHTDIQSVDELLNMIEQVRRVTQKPTGFKSVIGRRDWLEELMRKIKDRGIEHAPDFITLDSSDGGTGAAPQALMDNVGLPIKESLPWLIKLLEDYGLRDRIKVIASGKLVTPSMVAWSLASGADFANSARGFMFALGCIQSLQCHQNTCPTGITTHNLSLQKGLDPSNKSVRVASYHRNMTASVSMIAHSCGLAEPRQLKAEHVRVMMPDGFSVPLADLQPQPIIIKESSSY